jgi:hypothetical protein
MKPSLHIKAKQEFAQFLKWVSKFSLLVTIIWRGAEVLASLVQETCTVCERPSTLLWHDVGDHSMCDRLSQGSEAEKGE